MTARIDLDHAVCNTPEQVRSDVRQLLTTKTATTRPITADAWIDAFHLVRDLRLTVDLGKPASASYEVQLPGDNTAIQVTQPSDATTVPLTDVPVLAAAFPATPAPTPTC